MFENYLIDQNFAGYSAEEHTVWDTLYERQTKLLPGRAAPAFLAGLEKLSLRGPGIPDFVELSKRLKTLTGWQVMAVPGLVPDSVFFTLLANRMFPAGNFIRRPDQLDYLQEPDVFHDVFGHVPMLSDPVFADYIEAYGKGGLRALECGRLHNLTRLYWYTVEFGLIKTDAGARIFGAGIVSSAGETIYALESPTPQRKPFEIEEVMRTPYRIDDFQNCYFVIPSFEDLLSATRDSDFGPLYDRLAVLPDLPLPCVA